MWVKFQEFTKFSCLVQLRPENISNTISKFETIKIIYRQPPFILRIYLWRAYFNNPDRCNHLKKSQNQWRKITQHCKNEICEKNQENKLVTMNKHSETTKINMFWESWSRSIYFTKIKKTTAWYYTNVINWIVYIFGYCCKYWRG